MAVILTFFRQPNTAHDSRPASLEQYRSILTTTYHHQTRYYIALNVNTPAFNLFNIRLKYHTSDRHAEKITNDSQCINTTSL